MFLNKLFYTIENQFTQITVDQPRISDYKHRNGHPFLQREKHKIAREQKFFSTKKKKKNIKIHFFIHISLSVCLSNWFVFVLMEAGVSNNNKNDQKGLPSWPPRTAESEIIMRKKSTAPPFLLKTYTVVEDPATDEVISWNDDGTAFVVWQTVEFAKDVLPKLFKHCNFSSFVRQLNTYVRFSSFFSVSYLHMFFSEKKKKKLISHIYFFFFQNHKYAVEI